VLFAEVSIQVTFHCQLCKPSATCHWISGLGYRKWFAEASCSWQWTKQPGI